MRVCSHIWAHTQALDEELSYQAYIVRLQRFSNDNFSMWPPKVMWATCVNASLAVSAVLWLQSPWHEAWSLGQSLTHSTLSRSSGILCFFIFALSTCIYCVCGSLLVHVRVSCSCGFLVLITMPAEQYFVVDPGKTFTVCDVANFGSTIPGYHAMISCAEAKAFRRKLQKELGPPGQRGFWEHWQRLGYYWWYNKCKITVADAKG